MFTVLLVRSGSRQIYQWIMKYWNACVCYFIYYQDMASLTADIFLLLKLQLFLYDFSGKLIDFLSVIGNLKLRREHIRHHWLFKTTTLSCVLLTSLQQYIGNTYASLWLYYCLPPYPWKNSLFFSNVILPQFFVIIAKPPSCCILWLWISKGKYCHWIHHRELWFLLGPLSRLLMWARGKNLSSMVMMPKLIKSLRQLLHFLLHKVLPKFHHFMIWKEPDLLNYCPLMEMVWETPEGVIQGKLLNLVWDIICSLGVSFSSCCK